MLFVRELLDGCERIVPCFEEGDYALHERDLRGEIVIIGRKSHVYACKNGVDGREGGQNGLFGVGKGSNIVNEVEEISPFFEDVAAFGKGRKTVLDRDVEQGEIVLGEMNSTGGEVFIHKKILTQFGEASRMIACEVVEIGRCGKVGRHVQGIGRENDGTGKKTHNYDQQDQNE